MDTRINIDREKLAAMDKLKRTAFVNSLSGYKSLNLVGTANAQGQENLAIFNSVVHIGADPALLGMICRPDVVERNTLANIRETGCFTINAVQASFVDQAHQTSARYAPDQSEFAAVGLTPMYRKDFLAPFVEESVLQIALQLAEEYPIKKNNTHLIIGEIVDIFLPEGLILADGTVAFEQTDIVCGSSLNSYYKPELIKRLPYAKAK